MMTVAPRTTTTAIANREAGPMVRPEVRRPRGGRVGRLRVEPGRLDSPSKVGIGADPESRGSPSEGGMEGSRVTQIQTGDVPDVFPYNGKIQHLGSNLFRWMP